MRPTIGDADTLVFLPSTLDDGGVHYRWDAKGSNGVYLHSIEPLTPGIQVSNNKDMTMQPDSEGRLTLLCSTSTTTHTLTIPTTAPHQCCIDGVSLTFTPEQSEELGRRLIVEWQGNRVAGIRRSWEYHTPDDSQPRIQLYLEEQPQQTLVIELRDEPTEHSVSFRVGAPGELLVIPVTNAEYSKPDTKLPEPH